MPATGKEQSFTPFSLASEAEVATAIRQARNSAIQAVLTMILGDAYWFGSKRAAFRWAEFVAVPMETPSMTVKLTRGSGLVNDGVDHNGNWYLIWNDERTVVIEASSSPSLDRYDILCVSPKRVASGTVVREVIDGEGNISLQNAPAAFFDDFDIVVIKGTNGAGNPNLTRLNAWQAVPAGMAPIAVVRVRAAATTVEVGDLQDVREPMTWRTYPNELLPSGDLLSLLGPMLPPRQIGEIFQWHGDDEYEGIAGDTIFVDKSGGEPGVLRFKKQNGTVISLEPGP
jgi:hypothetical protein